MKIFLKIILFTIALNLQLAFTSETIQHGCLTRHVKESIANNKYRKKLYSKLTNGASDFLFEKWIFFGKLSIPLSQSLDNRALNFQNKYIPVLCDEIPEISSVKPFIGISTTPLETAYDFKTQLIKIHSNLKEALIEKNYDKLNIEIDESLLMLQKNPHYYCMVRHLLESIRLTAKQAQSYEELEAEIGIPTSQSISIDYIKSQLLILIPSLYLIDIPAIKFQQQGIPLVCSELPEVK